MWAAEVAKIQLRVEWPMTRSEGYKEHPGPITKGDILVIEIGGKVVPKRPDDPRPQWFMALADQQGAEPIPLKPVDDNKFFAPRLYKAEWGG